jgi:UDP-glucuronate decarboxylase
MRKQILVTGAAGFLGSNLCKALIDENDSYVIGIDNLNTGRKENIKELQDDPNFLFLEHDIEDPIPLSIKFDQIYNLACPASPPHYQKDPIKTMRVNVNGSLNLLKLAQRDNATILQTSTSEVYGNPKVHPQPESYLGNVNCTGPRACYDEGKRAAETLFFDYNRVYNTDIRIVRIFNTFGPNMDPDDGRVVSNFINQAINNEDITVYGDGSQTRSLCYVDDMVEGLILMMNNDENFIGPVNLGNPGTEISVKDLALVIKDLTNSESDIIFKELPTDDPLIRRPDISLAKEKLFWKPEVDYKDGIKKTIEYFKQLKNRKPDEKQILKV